MWNLKKNDTNEIIYKTNRPTDKKKKTDFGYQRRKVVGKIN